MNRTKKTKKIPNATKGQRPSRGKPARPDAADARHSRQSDEQASPSFHSAGRSGRGMRRDFEARSNASYWLYGRHAVEAAWKNAGRRIIRLVGTEEALQEAQESFAKAGVKAAAPRPQPQTLSRQELDRLLPPGSVHQGLAAQVTPLAIDTDDEPPEGARLILLLDQITDPHNVGAILRSCAAFGVDVVMMTAHHMPQESGVMAKTACGALDVVRIQRVANLSRSLTKLRDQGFWCVGLSEHATAHLGQMDLATNPVALVMGAEGQGLRRLTRETCDALASLPTQPILASLNVSNAAAVALYEVVRQKSV